jgi:hypothetical protein
MFLKLLQLEKLTSLDDEKMAAKMRDNVCVSVRFVDKRLGR